MKKLTTLSDSFFVIHICALPKLAIAACFTHPVGWPCCINWNLQDPRCRAVFLQDGGQARPMPGKTLQTKLFKKPGLNRLKANRCGSAFGDWHKTKSLTSFSAKIPCFDFPARERVAPPNRGICGLTISCVVARHWSQCRLVFRLFSNRESWQKLAEDIGAKNLLVAADSEQNIRLYRCCGACASLYGRSWQKTLVQRIYWVQRTRSRTSDCTGAAVPVQACKACKFWWYITSSLRCPLWHPQVSECFEKEGAGVLPHVVSFLHGRTNSAPESKVTDVEVTQARSKKCSSQRCQVALQHKMVYATLHLPISVHYFCRLDSVLVWHLADQFSHTLPGPSASSVTPKEPVFETNYESFTLKSSFVRSVHISCTVPSRLEHDAAFLLCSFEGFCFLQGCAERCLCPCPCQSRHAVALPIFSSMSTMAVWERIRVRHGRQVKVQYDGRKEIVTCEKPVATHITAWCWADQTLNCCCIPDVAILIVLSVKHWTPRSSPDSLP